LCRAWAHLSTSSGFLTAYHVNSKKSTDIVLEDATQPVISPDGKRVMYITFPAPQRQEIWVADIIEFVSLSEQVDTSTPTGKMIFTVLGAVAELERSLISERIRAGLRHAKKKGKRLGRPRVALDHEDIASLRAKGCGWKKIAAQLGVGVGTVLRAAQTGR
jgi:hypothetical protein